MFRRVCRGSVHATLAAIAVLAGCGPITYVGDVTRRASNAVEEARAAQAEKYAPYWWTHATEYLHKAREVAAHADFQGANRFGRLAAEAATQATTTARLAADGASRQPPGGADASPVPGRDAAPAGSRETPPPPSRDLPAPEKNPVGAKKPPLAPAKDPP